MSVSRRHLATAAGLALLPAAWLAAALAGGGWLPGSGDRATPAPQVAYTLLNGQQHHIGQLKGQVVLVNFWATSCTSCVAEMPAITATFEKFRSRSYQTLAVAMQYDAPANVASFAESRQLPFGVVIDNTGEIARQFGPVQATPTTFLINKRGQIVQRYLGAPDFAALHTLVEQLLAET